MRKFIERALKSVSKMDETQIKQLIGHLVDENELLETVIYSIPHGVIVSGNDHRPLFHNKTAERLLPLSKQDYIEIPVWDLIIEKDISDYIRDTLLSNDKSDEKDFIMNKGSSNTIITLSISPLVKEGRVQGNIIQISDVTDKRTQAARLRRAESLASLTTMAAGVAHEIKNPLSSMGIHIQLIQKVLNQNKSLDKETLRQYLNVVNEEIDRLNKIVVDYLFAVRPMDTHLEKTSLNKIVNETIEFLHFELEKNNIDCRLALDESLPSVMLDARFIKQALINLVKNAIYAMEDRGNLSVSTFVDNNVVCMSVKDNGSGIKEEVRNKIFEPYYTTRDFGSGLGLTLVYKIVKEHGGDIKVISREGEGSEFIIQLPLPQENAKLLSWKGSDEL